MSQPSCTLTLESRGLTLPLLGFTSLHGYLDFTSSTGASGVIEGYNPLGSHTLLAWDNTMGGLVGDAPASDQDDGSISGPWVCGARGILDLDVSRINAANIPYSATFGPNSSSALRYMVSSLNTLVLLNDPGDTTWYTVPVAMQVFGWWAPLPSL